MSMSSLPLGFRFHPTDVELVCYYLKRKIMGKSFLFEAISEIELYKYAPWDLPAKAQFHSKDLEWYFFCPRARKHLNGSRANRITDIGYWKITGKDRPVNHKSCDIGMKRTLIFHVGKAPKGERTNWVMYEYRLQDKSLADSGFSQDAYVLCKIFQKSGPGPKVGEQYGAPFNEADWEDDFAVDLSSFPRVSSPSLKTFDNQNATMDSFCQESRAYTVGEVSSNANHYESDGILLEHLADILASPYIHLENGPSEVPGMLDSTFLPGVGEETSGNICHSDAFNNDEMCNLSLSEFSADGFLELNDLCCLGESYASNVVRPDHSSFQDPINFYSGSQITTASGVGDCLRIGRETALEQTEQDLEIEAFVGSFLNPTAPGF
ncbi:NAC domain-containing protein 53-like isoform X1 [Curcuma longa]|uniref:NAC domain-containing protein 53-like isoform X1 n=1 Tax=Curcuma longa TaxID=136217 RepID=UPI003D9E2C42